MGKGKLEKFADMREYPHVFEYPYSVADNVTFDMKGNWNRDFFKNDNPIVLELGCGRGEYTVGLGRMYSDKNFIGVDIKGARMWSSSSAGKEETSSCVSPSSLLPRTTPTVHALALIPSLMSAMVSPYFNTQSTEGMAKSAIFLYIM